MEQTHEHAPITGNLRQAMVQCGWADGREVTITDLQPSIDAEPFLTIRGGRFGELCDSIDAVHAGLERENAELRERMAKMDNRGGSMHIGSATVTVTPTLDWSGVARELHAIADTLAGEAE